MNQTLEKPMMPGELAAKLGVCGEAITAAKKLLGLKRTFVFESEIIGAMKRPDYCTRPERDASVWISVRKSGGTYRAHARGTSIEAQHRNPEKAVAEVAAQLFQPKAA